MDFSVLLINLKLQESPMYVYVYTFKHVFFFLLKSV